MTTSAKPNRLLTTLFFYCMCSFGCVDPSPNQSNDISPQSLADMTDMRWFEMGPDLVEKQGDMDFRQDMPVDMSDMEDMAAPFVLSPEDQQKADTLRELYKTRCELMAECYPPIYELRYFSDLDTCIEEIAYFSFMRREVEHLATPQEQLDACLDVWSNAECIQVFHDTPDPACELVGKKEAGKPCVNHIGCQSGFCYYTYAAVKEALCDNKVCAPDIEVGAPCSNGEKCPHDMKCVSQEGELSTCQRRLAAGEGDCRGGTYFSLCQYGTRCDDETGLCTPEKREGERCGSAGSCLLREKLKCPIDPQNPQADGVCTLVPDDEWYLPEGSLCTNGDQAQRCAIGTRCSSRSECVEPSPVGGPCERSSDCEFSAFCNDENVCQSNYYEDVCL